MKVNIKIECETIGEFTAHLYEIIRQVKKTCKRNDCRKETEKALKECIKQQKYLNNKH